MMNLSIMKTFQILFRLVFSGSLLAVLTTCSDDEITFSDSLTLEFSAKVNGQPLVFNSQNYITASGNEINIDRIKFYISNIELINTSTSEAFVEQNGYHLVRLNNEHDTFSFDISGIRSDFQYDKIKYSIGVDEARNMSIDNVGDLDPANDMAWNWNTGYKFFLMEGDFFPEMSSDKQGLVLHIGLGRNFKTQEFLLDVPSNISGTATMQFDLDPLAPLNGPNVIDLNDKSSFMVDVESDKIAENYASEMIQLMTTSL
ncbi:MAG: hypothetical protein ACI9GZ_004236 [Bacteroidia bacterium]|jgi:hypothetical protein